MIRADSGLHGRPVLEQVKEMREKAQLSPEIWEVIPIEIKERGYYSVNEVAWFKEDALKVLELIKECGHGIIGVDVWIPTALGATIPQNVYDLDLSGLTGLEWEQLVVASHERAVEFIGSFWDRVDVRIDLRGMKPVFNIWDWPREK